MFGKVYANFSTVSANHHRAARILYTQVSAGADGLTGNLSQHTAFGVYHRPRPFFTNLTTTK